MPVEEVRGIFGRARVVATPYHVGYQSGVIHVAMTMARAVVTSDVGDMSVAVRDGETGLVVPPGNAAELADALTTLLDDPARAREMGDRARARVEQHYRLDQMAERTLALYREVLC